MSRDLIQTGRAKTVLVFSVGEHSTAVVSWVVVSALPGGSSALAHAASNEQLTFTGPVVFDERTVAHLRDVVVPVAARILAGVGILCAGFDISVANIDATSAHETGARISGFSTDVAVLLATISAGLQIPMAEGVVTTGHLASSDGTISAVGSLPAKLKAAVRDRSIRRFLYPDPRGDNSMAALSPRTLQDSTEAIIETRRSIELIAVSHVSELLEAGFDAEQIVLASLQQGFFENDLPPEAGSSPVDCAVRFLLAGNAKRFWNALERALLSGSSDRTRRLLEALTYFYIRAERYPPGLGQGLLQLVCSLPPATRRMKTKFPLLDAQLCIALSQFAARSNHGDVRVLHAVAAGETIGTAADRHQAAEESETSGDLSGRDALDRVLDEISQEALTRQIGAAVDNARATYQLDGVVAQSHDHFLDTVTTYYLHLLRHTRRVPAEMDADSIADEALARVQAAFSDRGGLNAAEAEAFQGTSGGLRFVLDAMTDHFKNELKSQHVRRILKQAINPLDDDEKTAFMAAFFERLGPILPEDIRARGPAWFAEYYETVIRLYARSVDDVREVFRRM